MHELNHILRLASDADADGGQTGSDTPSAVSPPSLCSVLLSRHARRCRSPRPKKGKGVASTTSWMYAHVHPFEHGLQKTPELDSVKHTSGPSDSPPGKQLPVHLSLAGGKRSV